MSERMTDEAGIRAVLAQQGVAERLEGVHAREGMVQVSLRASREEAAGLEAKRPALEAALRALPGVKSATVVFTAHTPAPGPLPGVGKIIAVASGKGGVGKSTVAVNLAVALALAGKRVGLLDADIYGPSLPTMLGISASPEVHGGMIQPHEVWGIKAMSIGFLVPAEKALVWRGPMVMGALNQLLTQVNWGTLDVMVIDLPPGTGDAQLTLAQKAKPDGAVIVSTPQDLALADARRGVAMFAQVGVKVLGVVENMSYFCCPNCGHRTEIFGHGGAAAEAARLNVPFLGEIPLLPAVRAAGDAGTPVVAADPASEAAAAFRALAAKVA
jgi:ATP-binding protein involved in chromosome partitioning